MLSKQKFTEIIGSNVRKEREKRKLTQDELAHICGFYRTYINLIETAKRTPSSYNLHRVARGLKIDIAKLYPSNS